MLKTAGALGQAAIASDDLLVGIAIYVGNIGDFSGNHLHV